MFSLASEVRGVDVMSVTEFDWEPVGWFTCRSVARLAVATDGFGRRALIEFCVAGRTDEATGTPTAVAAETSRS